MKAPASRITAVAGYAPARVVTNEELEGMVMIADASLSPGCIERLFGVKERRFVAAGEQVSDLAAAAGRKILSGTDPATVDCLIFAAASADLIEPATSNIIQQKLGLSCPAFDVKNACNSFVTALNIANAFIATGQHKKILIVTGEVLSHAIKYNLQDKEELIRRLAAYSFGDAGAAALIEPAAGEAGLYSQRFATFGEHWDLCTIPGGGSMHPHDPDMNFFEGKTADMRDVFLEQKGVIVEQCLQETGWRLEEIDHFFMHHVSKSTFDAVAVSMGAPSHRFYHVIEQYGNIAAASVPFAMGRAVEDGTLKRGDKIMLIGLAAGISMSVQLMIW